MQPWWAEATTFEIIILHIPNICVPTDHNMSGVLISIKTHRDCTGGVFLFMMCVYLITVEDQHLSSEQSSEGFDGLGLAGPAGP